MQCREKSVSDDVIRMKRTCDAQAVISKHFLPEVEQDIEQKDSVDAAVDDHQFQTVERLVVERNIRRNHNRRIKGKQQNDPIPNTLEIPTQTSAMRLILGQSMNEHYVFANDCFAS